MHSLIVIKIDLHQCTSRYNQNVKLHLFLRRSNQRAHLDLIVDNSDAQIEKLVSDSKLTAFENI